MLMGAAPEVGIITNDEFADILSTSATASMSGSQTTTTWQVSNGRLALLAYLKCVLLDAWLASGS